LIGADINAWRNGYTTAPYETTNPEPLQAQGTNKLPSDMTPGTYFRNGHGRFESDDGVVATHPFDADGHMVAITLDPTSSSEQGEVMFCNKFVQTAAYLNDRATGKMSGRGIFGTKKSGGWMANAFDLTFKNVGNTNVLYAPETQQLFALWEGGMPHVLDPKTLDDVKLDGIDLDPTKLNGGKVETNSVADTLNGLLDDARPAFSAHPRYDPRTDTWVSFACAFDANAGKSTVRCFELHASNMTSVDSVEISLDFEGSGLLHDFFITENYIGFALNTADIDPVGGLKAALGIGAFAGAMKFNNDNPTTPFILIPRREKFLEMTPLNKRHTLEHMDVFEDERLKVIDVPYFFNFHFSNAYETETGEVVVDSVQTKEVELGTDLTGGLDIGVWDVEPFVMNTVFPTKLVRWTLDPKQKMMAVGVPSPQTLVGDRACEFPVIPRKLSSKSSRYCYMVGAHKSIGDTNTRGGAPSGSIVKADTQKPGHYETFEFEPHEFTGEVAFVPKTGDSNGEDAGYLVGLVLNGKDMTTDLVVLDVEGKGALERGPVTRYTLPAFIPHGLHGSFAEGLTL
jgi:all-trans-8'-apo-beta-carotenal 15,15'-oxygenase